MRPTISNLRALDQLQLGFRWNIDFTSFPTAVGTHPTSAEMNIRCESTDLPKEKMSLVELNIRGHKINYNGITDAGGDIKLVFVETVKHEVIEFFREWREKSYNSIIGNASNKADLEAIVTLYLLDNNDDATYKYELHGCLMSDYDPGKVTDTNDFIKPGITIHYDYFTSSKL